MTMANAMDAMESKCNTQSAIPMTVQYDTVWSTFEIRSFFQKFPQMKYQSKKACWKSSPNARTISPQKTALSRRTMQAKTTMASAARAVMESRSWRTLIKRLPCVARFPKKARIRVAMPKSAKAQKIV